MGIAKKLLQTLEARRRSDGHNVVGVQGPPGIGKSTVGLALALNLDHDFSTERVHYDRDDWGDIVKSPKGMVFLLDEGANIAMNRTWQNRDQVKLMQILNMIRQRNHTLIWCTPNLERLDIIIREDLLTHKVNCYRLGRAKVLSPKFDKNGEPDGWNRWPGTMTWRTLNTHPIWKPYVAAKEANYLRKAEQLLNDPRAEPAAPSGDDSSGSASVQAPANPARAIAAAMRRLRVDLHQVAAELDPKP